jgi:hypothetical protein
MLRTAQITGKVSSIERLSTTRLAITIYTPMGYAHEKIYTRGECAGDTAKQASAQLSLGDNITFDGILERPSEGLINVKLKGVHYNITQNKQPIQEALEFRNQGE